jgi:hypothetical protein
MFAPNPAECVVRLLLLLLQFWLLSATVPEAFKLLTQLTIC